MSQQDHVDQLIRSHIGDLIVQIVMLKAQIATLEQTLAERAKAEPEIIEPKPNGRHEKRVENG